MELAYQDNTYLSIRDEYNKIRNEMLFIVGKSGYGKGLASEAILEEFKKAGYIVISIADPKRELEMAYAMFEPKETYHLHHLNLIGKKPSKYPVKIYHPFTFRIPRKPLPDMEFYTLSLKELGRSEWSMIAETKWDTDTIKLLMNVSEEITNEDGIYGFLHHLQDLIKGKTEKRHFKPDPKNFFLSVSSGTLKSLQDISNYFKPFRVDYFLSSHNSNTLLNWKKILSDPEHYHVFVSNWIKDPKLRELLVLTVLNGIIEHKDYATRPIVVFIPEIRYLTPFKPEGYYQFLALGIKESLSMMRSMGKGMSALYDTQVWSGVDEEVRNSATTTFIGELGGAQDIEKLSKAMNYRRDTRKLLMKQESENTYLVSGKEDVGGIRLWLPCHMHCEPHYKFLEIYKKYNPEGLKNYTELITTKKREVVEEMRKYRDREKKRDLERKKELDKAQIEKESKKIVHVKVKEEKERAREVKSQTKDQIAIAMSVQYDKHIEDWKAGRVEEKKGVKEFGEPYGYKKTKSSLEIKRGRELRALMEAQKKQPSSSPEPEQTSQDSGASPDVNE